MKPGNIVATIIMILSLVGCVAPNVNRNSMSAVVYPEPYGYSRQYVTVGKVNKLGFGTDYQQLLYRRYHLVDYDHELLQLIPPCDEGENNITGGRTSWSGNFMILGEGKVKLVFVVTDESTTCPAEYSTEGFELVDEQRYFRERREGTTDNR